MSQNRQLRRSDDPGVIKEFKAKPSYIKLKKLRVPMVFQAITKKGATPAIISYDDLKKDFPYILIDYIEKKIKLWPVGNFSCMTPQKKQGKEQRQQREKDSTRDRQEINIKEQHRERMPRQRQERQRPKERQAKLSRDKDIRPVRSCRNRKDSYKLKESSNDLKQQPSHHNAQPPQPLPSSSNSINQDESIESSLQQTDEQQFTRKSLKKILDYDQMVDDLGLFNLISPCVIPSSKVKNDLNNLNPGIFYPPLPPLKEIQREFSSEGFKDSEESEFLLDDRGMKDKKRSRERLQRELERINGRRKVKKIKKKRPSGGK